MWRLWKRFTSKTHEAYGIATSALSIAFRTQDENDLKAVEKHLLDRGDTPQDAKFKKYRAAPRSVRTTVGPVKAIEGRLRDFKTMVQSLPLDNGKSLLREGKDKDSFDSW
jgi:hypothetical protein